MGQYVSLPPFPDVLSAYNGMISGINGITSSASSIANSLVQYSPTTFTTFYDPNSVNTDINLVQPESLGDVDLPQVNIPSAPVDPTIAIPAIDLSQIDFPEYNIQEPSFNLPTAPNNFSESLPVKPVVDFNKEFPDAVSIDIPDVPTLEVLDIPSAPALSLPEFTEEVPQLTDLQEVDPAAFNYIEDSYNSELLDCIREELCSRLEGGTGLNPNVEQAIWDRGRDREHTASLQAERNLLVEQAGSGLNRPSGALQAALDNIRMETQAKLIELSREIMIKQAELEQENFKFSMQQAIALENILMREFNNIQNRALDVARFKFQILIDVYKIKLSKYQAELELFKASVQAFELKLKAELSKLEEFRANIEAQKLINEINAQTIQLYISRVNAVKSIVDIYKTQVEAVSEQLRAEGLKIESYKADVDAFKALVQAKSEEFRGYAEAVRAETSKAQLFDAKVKAYTSRVQAYSNLVDVEAKKAEIELSGEKLKTDVFATKMDAYLKRVQAEQTNSTIVLDKYKTKLQKYVADLSYNTASSNLGIKSIDQQISQIQFNTNAAIESAKINAEVIKARNAIQVEALKASGSIYAQLASSALNAVNVNISSNQSVQGSLNENYSL